MKISLSVSSPKRSSTPSDAIVQHTKHLGAAKKNLKFIEGLIKKYTKEIADLTKDVAKNADSPKLARKKSDLKDAKADLRKSISRKKAQEKLIVYYQQKIQKAKMKSQSSSGAYKYKNMVFDREDLENGFCLGAAAAVHSIVESASEEPNEQGYTMPPKTEQAWSNFQRWARQGRDLEKQLMEAYLDEH